EMLKARPAPSGKLPVVLKKGAGGVLFHEACGHGLEADLVGKDASVFRDRVGEQVASRLVTLVDDGTYAREWGTYAVDDEGNPARRNTLIEDGVLTDYMWDFLRARKDGRAQSGNGRRQSYQHLPMVRMTNTYVLAGEEDPDEIIRQTPYGIYCVQLGGGSVNTATGDFVFGMTASPDGLGTASSSRRTRGGPATPTCACSRATSSRSPPRRPRASASASSSGAVRASPTRAHSTTKWWPRPSPRRGTTPSSARPT